MADLTYNQIAKIKVFGIGGAGSNAVNRMVQEGVQGVEFYVANTDLQALDVSPVANKIQLGREGLGAGGNPDNGRKAAVESEDAIRQAMENADMVFLTAGLGGGTDRQGTWLSDSRYCYKTVLFRRKEENDPCRAGSGTVKGIC